MNLLKDRVKKFKAFLFSKDALSFLFFLFLSSIFWFVHAANKEQEKKITIPIRYHDVPKDIAITNQLPNEVKLIIKDQGVKLFSYSKDKLSPISIDLSGLNKKRQDHLLSSDQILPLLLHRMQPTTTIIGYSPDSIRIEYKKLRSKTVPVRLTEEIELAQQYILSNEIEINPSEITIYGDASALKKLSYVKTTMLRAKDVKETSTFNCELEPINSVKFSTKTVEVKVSVEMFTEKKITLPIKIKNDSENFIIKAFPPEVDVIYNIGESIYNTTEDHIEVVIDHNDIKKNRQEKYKPTIVYSSPKIFNVKIIPEEIEFVLKELKN